MSAYLRLNGNSPSIKHFFDIIYNVEPNLVNVDNLKAIIRDKAWEELPDVMKLAQRPTFQYVSQYFLLPQTNDKICVVKHIYVKEDKVKGQYVRLLIKGTGHEVSWGTQNKHKARRGLQYMLEQLGGNQFRHFTLSAEKRKAIAGPAPPGEEDQNAGWDFIIEHGERDKGNLKQLRWIHRHIHREGSPINGWSEKLVQRALDSLANDGTMAAVISRYDLTMDALEPEILEVMEQIVPYLRGHALWLLGEPGVGKTPLGRIIAMMFSRYHGGTGTFRSASDFDFFRGVFFDKTCPALYDDGEIGGEIIKKKKAFSDVGDQETILKERWTAAKFVQHQLRVVLDNQYDPSEEPEETTLQSKISHSVFMKMVRPALGYIANADSRAILKRAAFMIFTKEWVYYRPPTEKEVEVARLKWSRGDLLKESCKHIIANFKDGGSPPSDYEERVAWETEWLKEAFRKHDNPAQSQPLLRSSTPLLDEVLRADGHPPASSASAASVPGLCPVPGHRLVPLPGVPKLEPQEHKNGHAWLARETAKDPVHVDTDRASEGWSNLAPVKQEPSASVFPRLARSSTKVIELDTPSPQSRREQSASVPPNPDHLPGLAAPSDEEEDFMPALGDAPDEGFGGPGSQDGFNDICLISALQSLGLPVPCDRDGPFPISYGNKLLLPFGVQLGHKPGLRRLLDGSYVVHDKSNAHFFALQVREGLILMKDGGHTFSLPSSSAMDMLTSDAYTFYILQKQSDPALLSVDAVGGATLKKFTTSLEHCVCFGCSGTLGHHRYVDAVLYTLDGPIDIMHEQKQCTSRNCRTCYGYNYRWEHGQKVNTVCLEDLTDDVLFINSKKAFSIKYLKYHEELFFRGHLSSAAVSHAYRTVHEDAEAHILSQFHKLHGNALFYFMSLRELEPLGVHQSIVIDDELSDAHLDLYESFCLSSLLPPTDRRKVTSLVIDGHQKVKMQCAEAPSKRAGRPRKSATTVGNYTNGWMMACDPASGRIVGLKSMYEPEDNQIASETLEQILWLYPKADCLIYDRACAFQSFAKANANLGQIKYFSIDAFHAHTHSKTCPCNPRA